MKIIDNKSEILKDDFLNEINSNDKIAIVASCFSIYAFKELYDKLKDVDELYFLLTSPSFLTTEKDKFDIEIEDLLENEGFKNQLRNILNKKAVVREFAQWIKKDRIHFRSRKISDKISGFVAVQSADKKSSTVYAPLQAFTTAELGISKNKNVYNLIQKIDDPWSKQYLRMFNAMWKDKKELVDVKANILDRLEDICAENSPEFMYYVALNYVFREFISDMFDEDFCANERVGFKNSIIWTTLFDFQKDAALAIIGKLERFNGCILADSVGLGKTYTALAVIKYYESRNKNVLVLCPKKLSENWNTFRGNFINNPFVKDRFRYDVLYHTDINRNDANAVSNGINLSHINWDNYDILIIDESHNFRNGGSTNSEKMNRYQTLMEKVIRSGVNTKVLMLSATPVNNKFNDLKNQLQLAYKDGDPRNIEDKMGTRNTIDGIFKRAQMIFNKWSNLNVEKRTTENLIRKLDFDFFELLDSVTIARSRKNIQTYYDMNSIGTFPRRLSPLSYSPQMTDLENVTNYNEIFNELLGLCLSIYTPSHYIKPEKRPLYEKKFREKRKNVNFSQEDREQGLRRLMAINLMKRLESSICSFTSTLERIKLKLSDTIEKIEEFTNCYLNDDNYIYEYDFLDEDGEDELFSIGNIVKINFSDMRIEEWKQTLIGDKDIVDNLYNKVKFINASHDMKLNTLFKIIYNKIQNPINKNNKKMLIFTAFSDTAEYLFENVSRYVHQFGLNVAMITGKKQGKSTINGLGGDFNTILSCFSPISKNRDKFRFNSVAATADIDILIGTDCISEGQNLQDCDYCVNYDIHWNPVRIIQRYGRIDRIGSKNACIQLVNLWPDVSLDEYINLKQKVETRMKIVNITATPEEKVLSNEEKVDLEYRKSQLEKLKNEVIDIEEMSSSVSITDLGLNEFKLDLLDYTKNNLIKYKLQKSIYSVVNSKNGYPAGVIFVLKNMSVKVNVKKQNRLHPFYLVYIEEDGKIKYNYLSQKETLTALRMLCKGNNTPNEMLYKQFNSEIKDGDNISKYIGLLEKSIQSIIKTEEETNINSLFSARGTNFTSNKKNASMDDFELICFLVVK